MSSVVCDEDGCNRSTVATCMHCNHRLCLKCLTRHQQPINDQICQLTDDMNKLLLLSSSSLVNNNDDKQHYNHPQISANRQYMTAVEQIDIWEAIMAKKIHDLVTRARHALQMSFEQISFEIDEWSTRRQVELQQLTNDIEQLALQTTDESEIRRKIDLYNRQIQRYTNEHNCLHVELNFLEFRPISISPCTLQLFHLVEHSTHFDLALIHDPPHASFSASSSSSSSSISSNRHEKMSLPSVLVSARNRIVLFSNKTKQMNIFSISGTRIDQFPWTHNDIVDMCYEHSSIPSTDDRFFVLSTTGSIYSFSFHSDQHSYSWKKLITGNETYYTQIFCHSKSSHLYLFMPSKHRLDQWIIDQSNRKNIVQYSNQLILTNDHIEHLCASTEQLALLVRDKKKPLYFRIELRNFTDLLVLTCSIALEQRSRPMRLIFDNRQGFLLVNGNQLCSFETSGDIISKRTFEDMNEIKRVTFCQRSTVAILTDDDQLLFYLLSQ